MKEQQGKRREKEKMKEEINSTPVIGANSLFFVSFPSEQAVRDVYPFVLHCERSIFLDRCENIPIYAAM